MEELKGKTLDERAEMIVDALTLRWYSTDTTTGTKWTEKRVYTSWGTKTRAGLVAMIKRIMTEEL